MSDDNIEKVDKQEPQVKGRETFVGMSPLKKKIMVAALMLLAAGGIYSVLHRNKSPVAEKQNKIAKVKKLEREAKPVVRDSSPQFALPPQLPKAPPLTLPIAPPAPIPKTLPPLPQNIANQLPQAAQQLSRIVQNGVPANVRAPIPVIAPPSSTHASRNNSGSIFAFSGGGSQSDGFDLSNPASLLNPVNIGSNINKLKKELHSDEKPINDYSPPQRTGFAQVKSTYVGDLRIIITQGKMIDAILETAINTDISGTLRAIISRDVYADSGYKILIPKGSRVIGQYTSDVKAGVDVIQIVWNRLIKPNGIDVAIQSPSTDTLGRNGTRANYVDDKFMLKLKSAVLVSSITAGASELADRLSSGNVTTTTNTDGSVTTTGSASAILASKALGSATTAISSGITDYTNALTARPTLYVNQGTRIKILVNRDLIFSPTSDGLLQ